MPPACLLACLLTAAPLSHPPMRALPTPSQRPLAAGPARFADARRGDDKNDGSEKSPWRTLTHALGRLRPGETLYLRGGVYHEHVTVRLRGEPGKPITIRSFPAELATIDGGFREFLDAPKTAWEPVPGGKGEYRSTKRYPDVGDKGRRGVRVLGHFADSMVPLHGYRFVTDFRGDNPYWNLKKNVDPDGVLWCGPGLWFDPDSQRIHARLAHTRLRVLGQSNYKGETDPRRLPLSVAGPATPLRIDKSRHVRFQDVVVRGSAGATVEIVGSEAIELDGVAVFGGSPAMQVRTTTGLRLVRCVVRGLTAPWSSRASHKYRGNSAYLVLISGERPGCRDFEFSHCEFSDNHDGLVVGTLRGLRFHHNLVDHFDDDGLYLTLQRPAVPERLYIYQNVFSRCLTTFAFAQSGKGVKNDVGPGAFICRNIFDLRRGTPSTPPASARDDRAGAMAWNRLGRLGGDHGSPIWEPLFFYHNTVLTAGPAWRDYYAAGLGSHTHGTRRRLFNNVFVQVEGLPGFVLPAPADDVTADGNLFWSVKDGPGFRGDLFARFRAGKAFAATKVRYAPGLGAADRFADPRFVSLPADPTRPLDLRLNKGSPAVDGGVAIPVDWPDPLRRLDAGKPDMGALPLGAAMLRVGPTAP